jgi:hypothetical protein
MSEKISMKSRISNAKIEILLAAVLCSFFVLLFLILFNSHQVSVIG